MSNLCLPMLTNDIGLLSIPQLVGTIAKVEDQCLALGVTLDMVIKSRGYGNPERWHSVMQKMMMDTEKNKGIKIAVLGGSVTAGHECEPDQGNVPNHICAWPSKLEAMLNSWQPSWNVKIDNFATGGKS